MEDEFLALNLDGLERMDDEGSPAEERGANSEDNDIGMGLNVLCPVSDDRARRESIDRGPCRRSRNPTPQSKRPYRLRGGPIRPTMWKNQWPRAITINAQLGSNNP